MTPCRLINRTLIITACTALLASCASNPPSKAPADRDAINREMPLVSEYEGKRSEVKKAVNILAMNGLFDGDSGKEVKESLDIEYVYYEASIVSLARGDMDEYRNYVALAQKELDRAKSALVSRVQSLNQSRQGPIYP